MKRTFLLFCLTIFFLTGCEERATLHIYTSPLVAGDGLDSLPLSSLDGEYVVQNLNQYNMGLAHIKTNPVGRWDWVKSFVLPPRISWSPHLKNKFSKVALHALYHWKRSEEDSHFLLEARVRISPLQTRYTLFELVVTTGSLILVPLKYDLNRISPANIISEKKWDAEKNEVSWNYHEVDNSGFSSSAFSRIFIPTGKQTLIQESISLVPLAGPAAGSLIRWAEERYLSRFRPEVCSQLFELEKNRGPLEFKPTDED